MRRPLYIVMVGLPGSGKSTLAEAIVQQSPATPGIAYLSSDLYVESMAEAHNLTYNEAFADCIGPATETMNRDRRWAIANKMDIIHDQTNLTARKRISILKSIPKEYEKIACAVRCDETERQRRLSGRIGKTIPPNINANMVASYTVPTLDEGFNIILNDETPHINDAMLRLFIAKTSILNPVSA